MVVLSSYPIDVRVRREAEALVKAGKKVDVICRTKRGEPAKEIVNGVTTYRITLNRTGSGKLGYFWEYPYFFLRAFMKLTFLFFKNYYDIIHVHNMPDFLVFTAIIPKLFGKKIILDLHDPMPELYMSMFSMSAQNPVIRFLKQMERSCIRFADHVLTPNISFRNLFVSRGCPDIKISIVMNSPDENIFMTNGGTGLVPKDNNNFVIMYHGAIVERHGLDILVDAVSLIQHKIPNLKLWIYGGGNFLKTIRKKIIESDLSNYIDIKGMVIVDKIAEAIKQIDLGVIPNRINPFTQINFPVRTFEYIVMNKPVVVPRTQGISDYFDEESIFFFEPGNVESLASAIMEIYEHPKKKELVLRKSIDVFNNYRWESQKQNLIELTNKL